MGPSRGVSFVLPGQPQAWQRAGLSGGRHYVPPATAAYERAVALEAKVAMRGRPPMEGPLRLEADFSLAVPPSYGARKRVACLAGDLRPTHRNDIDNLAKALCDALNGVVWVDDGQVVEARVAKRWAPEGGLAVTVEPIFPETRTAPGG